MQRCKAATGELHRIQPDRVCRRGPIHMQVQQAGLVKRQPVQESRYLAGDARPHQDVVHTSEHGSVCRTRRGHLDLLQEVDPHHAVMALLGQPHLGEVGHDRQLQECCARAQGQLGDGRVGLARGPSAFAEVPLPNPLRHRRHREVRQGAPHGAIHVAILKPPGDHDIQCRPRDHAELAGPGHRLSQPPRRDGHTHSALDDNRQRAVGGR